MIQEIEMVTYPRITGQNKRKKQLAKRKAFTKEQQQSKKEKNPFRNEANNNKRII